MSDWLVKDSKRGVERPFESRSEAEEKAGDMKELIKDRGGDPERVDVIPPNEGENQSVDVVDHSNGSGAVVEEPTKSEGNTTEKDTNGTESDIDSVEAVRETRGELPDDGPSVDEDPLVWMPDEFTDTIDGTVAINRKGFEVLAHHYDIQCETELCNELTTEDRVVFKATATDADGDTYSAFGSASTERGDDAGLLVEMSDTRAYKRSVSRATGVGMVAVSELQNEL
jgi:hypothetical protein